MNKPVIRKAVFPVAGFGTRFLPATKAHPKEMMPIVDKPLIQYAVEEAIEAGITEMIFVTNSSKRSIEDHFDSHFELETRLEAQGKMEALEIVQNILPKHIQCVYVRQAEPLGLGHAIYCARSVIADEPFAVVLADDLIQTRGKSCLSQMIEQYEQIRQAMVAVEEVRVEDLDQYGVVELESALAPLSKILHIVEKPKPQDAPSQYGVVGRYILNPDIFSSLEVVSQVFKKEIDLTSAIELLIQKEPVYAFSFSGKRYDCGNKLGYLKAIVSYGVNHPDFGKTLRSYIDEELFTEH